MLKSKSIYGYGINIMARQCVALYLQAYVAKDGLDVYRYMSGGDMVPIKLYYNQT